MLFPLDDFGIWRKGTALVSGFSRNLQMLKNASVKEDASSGFGEQPGWWPYGLHGAVYPGGKPSPTPHRCPVYSDKPPPPPWASTSTLSLEKCGLEGFWAPDNTSNRKAQQATWFLKKKKKKIKDLLQAHVGDDDGLKEIKQK